MADYDLGTAHGQIVVTYDGKGSKQAQDDFDTIGKKAEHLGTRLQAAGRTVTDFAKNVDTRVASAARSFTYFAGGLAILAGLVKGITSVGGAMMGLKGGLGILGALGTTLGGLPASVQGFPTILKRIMLLGSAITLFAGSSRLLGTVASRFKLLAPLAGIFKTLGDGAERAGSPIIKLTKLLFTIGAAISATKTVMLLAKGIGILSAGIAGLGAAAFTISGLIDAIAQLSGALGLLPAAAGLLALAFGTVKVATSGMGKAFKALATGDAAKLDEALKKLAPSAREVVLAVRDQQSAWNGLRLDVQQRMFEGLGGVITQLAGNYLPLLRTHMGGVATDINGVVKEVAKLLNAPSIVSSIGTATGNTRTAFANLLKTVMPITQALLDLWAVGTQVLVEITGGAGAAAEKFRRLVDAARESGQLAQWMRDGWQAVKDLVAIVINLGVVLKSVFSAITGGEGDNFLAIIRQGTEALRAFVAQAAVQDALRSFGELVGNTLTRWIEIFRVAWEQLSPAIITLIPVVTQLADAMSVGLIAALIVLGPLIQAVASVLAFLSPVLAPIVGTLFGIGLALKGFGLIAGIVAKTLPILTLGFKAVTLAFNILKFAFFTNPWIGLIAAVIALVVIIVMNWDTIMAALMTAWTWIQTTAISIWNSITGFFTSTGAAISAAVVGGWNTVVGYLVGLWNQIWATATTIWNAIVAFFVGIGTSIVQSVVTAWNAIIAFLTPIWEVIFTIMRYAAAILLAIFFTIWKPIEFLIMTIWNAIVAFLTAVWTAIFAAATAIWTPIAAFFSALWAGVQSVSTTVWNAISSFLTMIWNAVASAASTVWNAITTAISVAVNAASSLITTIWNAIWGFLQPIWNTISSVATTIWNAITSAITVAMNSIWAVIQTVWNGISSFFTGMWNTISGIFSGAVANIMGVLGGLWNQIAGMAGTAINLLVNAGRNIVTGLWNGIMSMGNWLWNQVMNWIRWAVPGPILQFLGISSPSKWMRDNVGKNIPPGIGEGVQAATGKMVTKVRDMAQKIGEASQVVLPAAKTMPISPMAAAAAAAAVNPTTGTGTPISGPNGITTPSGGVVAPGTRNLPPATQDAIGQAQTVIENLTLQVAGNLDPTNKLAWNEAMKSIREGIRVVDKAQK